MKTIGKAFITALGAVLLLTTARPALAQNTGAGGDAALRTEVEAMHRSISELVTLFKQFMDDQARRDRSGLLIRRIDLLDRQIATGEAQLKTLRDELSGYEKGVAAARSLMESTRQMQAFDKDNKAGDIFNAEASRAQTEEQKAQMGVDTTNQKILQLEAEQAQRRQQLKDLEAQLARDGR